MLSLLSAISRLKRNEKRLKRQLRMYRNKLMQAQQLLFQYSVEFAFPDFITSQLEKVPEYPKEFNNNSTSNTIISEMIRNSLVKPHKRKYSFYFKQFSYSIYVVSQAAYRILHDKIPLPSESLLRKQFSKDVNDVETMLVKNPMTSLLYAQNC